MQINNLKARTIRKSQKTVGRGGKRGKTSGKGGKGQTARAGHRVRPEVRDVIKKLPKLRGRGVNSNKSVGWDVRVINLSSLNKFEDGATVSPKELGIKGRAKILSNGEITKKLTVQGFAVSKGAKAKIEKAGGKST